MTGYFNLNVFSLVSAYGSACYSSSIDNAECEKNADLSDDS